jgi:hypothetical protein
MLVLDGSGQNTIIIGGLDIIEQATSLSEVTPGRSLIIIIWYATHTVMEYNSHLRTAWRKNISIWSIER